MAVIRHGPAPEDHYSLIPNDLARGTEISLQAKGLYLYLRSHREGWEMSTERIGEALGIHRDTVSKYVRELENLGYLDRQKVFDESGHFAGIAYILSSEPLLKNTVNGKTSDAGKDRAREKTVSGDLRQHKKTNSSKNTNDLKKTICSPHGEQGLFDDFWRAYPRKGDKAKAKQRWTEAIQDERPEAIIEAAKRFREEKRNTERRYIPLPSTWLNQQRWLDYDHDISKTGKQKVDQALSWDVTQMGA